MDVYDAVVYQVFVSIGDVYELLIGSVEPEHNLKVQYFDRFNSTFGTYC
jgi:hypothetical protein